MAKHDDLMDQYLEEQGLDSTRTLTRTITAVRQAAARRQSRQRWLKLSTVGCSLLSVALLLLAWRLEVNNPFTLGTGDYRPNGFLHQTSQMVLILIRSGGVGAGAVALMVGLSLVVKRWRRARRLACVETSIPDPGQVLKQVHGLK